MGGAEQRNIRSAGNKKPHALKGMAPTVGAFVLQATALPLELALADRGIDLVGARLPAVALIGCPRYPTLYEGSVRSRESV